MRVEYKDIPTGTKIYRFNLTPEYDKMKCKVGCIAENSIGVKFIKYEDGTRKYFRRKETYIPIGEYYSGTVLLLEFDPETAWSIFYNHERNKIEELREMMKVHKDRADNILSLIKDDDFYVLVNKEGS